MKKKMWKKPEIETYTRKTHNTYVSMTFTDRFWNARFWQGSTKTHNK